MDAHGGLPGHLSFSDTPIHGLPLDDTVDGEVSGLKPWWRFFGCYACACISYSSTLVLAFPWRFGGMRRSSRWVGMAGWRDGLLDGRLSLFGRE